MSFESSSARTAQAGANAFIEAFGQARSAGITAQANAAIAGINRAISTSGSQSQRTALIDQRTQEIINQKVDLASRPTAAWAIKPAAPASGSRAQSAVIGLVAGLVVGAALAYARASRRRGLRGRQDPAALYGVPLIGEIPASAAENGTWPGGKAPSAVLPMTDSPGSRTAEAFRFAAGTVERIRAVRGPDLALAFVSALAGSGRSMVVANLALAVAEGGTRVLVVDADGGVAGWLLPQDAGSGGLEQVLAGQRVLEECAQPSPLSPAVTVLGCGSRPASGPVTGAARAKAARLLLAEARKRYDLVLIDSPALLEVADAAELAAAADAAVIVAGAGELIRDHLALAGRLQLAGCDIAGFIYDHATRPRGGRLPGGESAPPPGDALPAADVEGTQPITWAPHPAPHQLPQG